MPSFGPRGAPIRTPSSANLLEYPAGTVLLTNAQPPGAVPRRKPSEVCVQMRGSFASEFVPRTSAAGAGSTPSRAFAVALGCPDREEADPSCQVRRLSSRPAYGFRSRPRLYDTATHRYSFGPRGTSRARRRHQRGLSISPLANPERLGERNDPICYAQSEQGGRRDRRPDLETLYGLRAKLGFRSARGVQPVRTPNARSSSPRDRSGPDRALERPALGERGPARNYGGRGVGRTRTL